MIDRSLTVIFSPLAIDLQFVTDTEVIDMDFEPPGE
jgi:hypothetical protein